MNDVQIIAALKASRTDDDIETAFAAGKIDANDYGQKTEMLNKSMGDGDVFFSSGDLTDKEKYQVTKAFFLTFAWKTANALSLAAQAYRKEAQND